MKLDPCAKTCHALAHGRPKRAHFLRPLIWRVWIPHGRAAKKDWHLRLFSRFDSFCKSMHLKKSFPFFFLWPCQNKFELVRKRGPSSSFSMPTQTDPFYVEFEEGLPRDEPGQDDHDQNVLKFFRCYSEDLTRSLPMGSMIQRLYSRGVITLKERAALVKKRDEGRATDEELAKGVLSLMESSAKTAEQRVTFLRLIEEKPVEGLSKAILRGIWTLLQGQILQTTNQRGNAYVYQPLGPRPKPAVYQAPGTKRQQDGKIWLELFAPHDLITK